MARQFRLRTAKTIPIRIQPGTDTCPQFCKPGPTERVEALKIHFQAGLSCREIAAEIGVSRNAVIGKISRLNLIRDKGGIIRTVKKEPASEPAAARRAKAAADTAEVVSAEA